MPDGQEVSVLKRREVQQRLRTQLGDALVDCVRGNPEQGSFWQLMELHVSKMQNMISCRDISVEVPLASRSS